MKCSDLFDEGIIAVIKEGNPKNSPISRWDIAKCFPDVPEKVLMAKLKKMVKAKKITGCACGCRGDFQWKSTQKR